MYKVAVLLATLLFVLPSLGQSVCTTTSLNIRSGPGTTYSILYTADPNTPFTKLGESGGWYNVKATGGSHNGQTGYGSAAYFIECGSGPSKNYSASTALQYAGQYWQTPNHQCSGAYDACTPWSCWGQYCGYASHGGDCANFVSQSIISGGHPFLNQGAPCRGYPCGKEEVGAKNLGDCLATVHGWKRTCGHLQTPPSTLKLGDVLIFHADSCSGQEAHATIVSQKNSATDVRITCHSPSLRNQLYTDVSSTKPYYEWLEFTG